MSERVKWYRDPVWQFWGAVVTVVSLVASGWFFWAERDVKELTVTVLTNTPLVSVATEVGGLGDLTIFYKREPADNVVLLQVKLENTGNRAIRVEDFSTPLKFVFGEDVRVLDAAVVETVPENLGMVIDVVDNVGMVLPLLLNKADRAILRFLVDSGSDLSATSGDELGFQVNARIVDIPEISALKVLDAQPRFSVNIFEVVWAIIAGVIFGIIASAILGIVAQRALQNGQVRNVSAERDE